MKHHKHQSRIKLMMFERKWFSIGQGERKFIKRSFNRSRRRSVAVEFED